jgi:hypothetical protein
LLQQHQPAALLVGIQRRIECGNAVQAPQGQLGRRRLVQGARGGEAERGGEDFAGEGRVKTSGSAPR